MKEVHVRAWCDACADEIGDEGGDVEPAVVEVTMAISPILPRLLDLCERHHKALVEPLARLLAESGQTPGMEPPKPAKRRGPASSDPGAYPCLWCDELFGSANGIRDHAAKVHAVRDASTTAIYGLTCPMCETTYGQAQAVGVHGNRAHGASNVAHLFRLAEAAGDPHGIVAARRAGGTA